MSRKTVDAVATCWTLEIPQSYVPTLQVQQLSGDTVLANVPQTLRRSTFPNQLVDQAFLRHVR